MDIEYQNSDTPAQELLEEPNFEAPDEHPRDMNDIVAAQMFETYKHTLQEHSRFGGGIVPISENF